MSERPRPGASFRDPSGFVFVRGPDLLRQVNLSYRDDYDRLIGSGLYRSLADLGWLVDHEETDEAPGTDEAAYRVLRPERVPFVSYPYEWSVSQLRDAALLTLDIQERALASGMTLKDASATNVQFLRGKPVLIDTLSFASYREGEPWAAYRQFCGHFLAPLALMSRVDARLGSLLRPYPDGIPLDLAAKLLPWRVRLRPGLFLHLALHAKFQGSEAKAASAPPRRGFGRSAMLGLVQSLRSAILGLPTPSIRSIWSNYQTDNSYSDAARQLKHRLVAEFLDPIAPETVWDLGANVGEYARIASAKGISTVAFDRDPACVEKAYRDARSRDDPALLPLVMDLANPSPGLGWEGRERASFLDRGPADLVMALALVHHLAIGNNVPLANLAEFFARAGRWLIVEFVPKTDPQVRRLLRARDDIFGDYHVEGFEAAFAPRFEIVRSAPLEDGGRILYLMRRKDRP